jgi:hypothetical protein
LFYWGLVFWVLLAIPLLFKGKKDILLIKVKTIRKTLSFLNFWLPPLLWAVIIFLLSARPTRRASQIYWQDFILKKTAHMIEYAIFTTLLYRAFRNNGVNKKNAGLFALILAVIYGGTDEFHQYFTPGREPTVRDVVFDTIGASFAVYYVWNLLPKAPKRLRKWAKDLQLL